MGVETYRDLRVWQRAMELVVDCYRMAESFPRTETYGLISQLQRAAVSIPANIAEGHGRRSTKEYLYHLRVAHGSLMEVETHVQIAGRLDYLGEDVEVPFLERSRELGRMLNALITSLQNRLNRGDS